MLRELRIENLLLIARAELRLGPGLNAITGETGAGKTVLAHSLDLLLGGRARSGIVRPGAEEAWVEGVFDLPEGFSDDADLAELADRLPSGATEVVVGRRVSAGGRTSAFLGGRAAAAADLKLLGARLLAFYGQHEHRKLTLASAQAEVLDAFAGPRHLELLVSYREAHREGALLATELSELRERDGTRERDLDLLRFELDEIDAAAPAEEEEADLAALRDRLRHAEGLRLAAAAANAAMVGGESDPGGAVEALAVAQADLEAHAGIDPGLDELTARAASTAIEVSEIAADLRSYTESVDADPEALGRAEERLDAFERLKRKHGGSIASVLAHAERCRAEVERLGSAEAREAELEEALAAATERRDAVGAKLSAGRRKAAKTLEVRVREELEQLAMPGARVEVGLETLSGGPGPAGFESVELRVAPNPGLEPAPIRDAASGGELSRIMLALSGVGAAASSPTLVFDEIDAGVGGNTARVVGERLRALGGARQVICITHLAQVASLANEHFRIEKSLDSELATAAVTRLEGDQVVGEITRMLGAGSEDEAASLHARELLAA